MAKARILIATDDPDLRQTVSDSLRLSGFMPLAVSGISDALAILKKKPVDLAIIDLELRQTPEDNLVVLIRSNHPATEVIVLTENSMIDMAMEATSHGAFSFLLKPCHTGQLVVNVQRALERKYKESELQNARETAERASRLKNEILCNIGHETRTPMSGVIGMAELLSDTGLTMEQTEYVHAVKSSAESLLRVINDILDYYRIEAGKLVLQPVQFNLRVSLEKSMTSHALRAAEKGLDFAFTIPSDIPVMLTGDPERLQQVIAYLASNAVKFTKMGRIVVSVAMETRDEAATLLHFSVTDSGIGIPAKEVGNIFEAFSRGDASTSRRYAGTGLGLTIAARLVEMMGGRIWVESETDTGSTFHFTARFSLPGKGLIPSYSSTTGDTRQEAHPASPEIKENLRILLAEDNPVNWKIAVRMLEKRGHWVTVAKNGKEAVAAISMKEEVPFDLVIMDVQMPEMDGLEATSLIRARERETGRHIPIIALTAFAINDDRELCLQAGMDGYVCKPLKSEELFSAIETAMSVSSRH